MIRTVATFGLIVALAAGGGCDSPTSPTAPTSPTSPSGPSSTTTGATPPPVSSPSMNCAAWASQQRGTGVARATGEVGAQREALYAAGGGIRAVDGRYYAAVFPSGFASASRRRVFVGLHGTGGAPETDWSVDWQHVLPSRDWAYLGLKYVDEATGVHDDPPVIYSHLKSLIADVRASCDVGSASFFLVGFSRGSAESYSVSYLDLHDRRLFKAIGNNSGAWPEGAPLPPVLAGFQMRGETNALSGAKHRMYCGELDDVHGQSMCVELQKAADFITRYGATVAMLYKDPGGMHGGLAKNGDAVSQMLAYFEGL